MGACGRTGPGPSCTQTSRICEPKISKTRQIRKKGQTGGFGDPQNRPDSVFDRNPVSGVGFNMFNVQLRDLN